MAVGLGSVNLSFLFETASGSFAKRSARVGAPEEFNVMIIFERLTIPADFELSGGLDSQTRSVHDWR